MNIILYTVFLAREDILRDIPSSGGVLFAPFCFMCGKQQPVVAGKLHKRRIPSTVPSR